MPENTPSYHCTIVHFITSRKAGAFVQWLKLSAWKVGDHGSNPTLAFYCSALTASRRPKILTSNFEVNFYYYSP